MREAEQDEAAERGQGQAISLVLDRQTDLYCGRPAAEEEAGRTRVSISAKRPS